jgi:hypothetical protein
VKLPSFFKAFLGIFMARYRAKNPKAGEMIDIIQTVLNATKGLSYTREEILMMVDVAGKRHGLLPEERELLRAMAEERLIKAGL